MIEVEQAQVVVVRSLLDLNLFVADYVMGWDDRYFFEERPGIPHYWDPDTKTCYTYNQWSPSESIEDAWQVVEKLEHLTPVIEALTQTEQQSAKWRCLFANISELGLNHGWHLSDSSTAPIAICLAALKTVGIEVQLELNDA
jgi:hypothetical protein